MGGQERRWARGGRCTVGRRGKKRASTESSDKGRNKEGEESLDSIEGERGRSPKRRREPGRCSRILKLQSFFMLFRRRIQ